MYSTSRITLFNEYLLSDLFKDRNQKIVEEIEHEDENYILNVNEQTYINHLITKYQYNIPIIRFEDISVSHYEDDIPIEYFPNYALYKEPHRTIKKSIIQYMIPCSGDTDLLRAHPSAISVLRYHNVELSCNTLYIRIINFSNDTQQVKRDFESVLVNIKQLYSYLTKDIETYNQSCERTITESFKNRKQRLLESNNLLAALGIPIKQNNNAPETFSIPRPAIRDQIIIKPEVYETGYKPEPTLDLDNYNKILKIIHDVGKNFERYPSVYTGKQEEDLRDHFLLVLDPNFSMGGASGEAFNKKGKTDIQIKYDSAIVFIAECKFWKGEKIFMRTIDQLLSYLTWRDTKASIIFFVRQKDFSAVLEKVRTTTYKHPNYLGFVDMGDETWFNYRFHINGDKNREVKLAIQLYHIPRE